MESEERIIPGLRTAKRSHSPKLDSAHLAELEALTGCHVMLVIEGQCQEADCQNAMVRTMEDRDAAAIFCARVKELVLQDLITTHFSRDGAEKPALPQVPVEEPSLKKCTPPEPIIDIRPRLRCVL